MKVRAKKQLGQHFLRDLQAAQRIVGLLSGHGGYHRVLEIGPGMGVLTQYLLKNPAYETYVVELDRESVAYLKIHFPELTPRIIEGDFLRMPFSPGPPTPQRGALNSPEIEVSLWGPGVEHFAIIGNFPYNISSQIFFKILEDVDRVPEIVCMVQKEVGQRIASPPGNKDYGILSVLLQAWYDIEYAFTVPPGAFEPPPKVNSGVIRLRRNNVTDLGCDAKKFKLVVKTAFNQRRKTLRNALKPVGVHFDHPLLDLRAERLGVAEFVLLTKMIGQGNAEL
ncbi:MAG: 16S rRNA (adenine(1518)-N(6)/adenine(1519)-N(6))-dimethyltransferase RsmA [Cytophagaceae bacterium]|nr:16S rRNA (adenine(1518)-N(6)/adenine(1519)-N(6))-dimethyltransferase RsmA [Cytophagaceae bacterium]